MPLKCKKQTGETLFAFSYNAEGWQKLAGLNRRERNLVMPCCDRAAVLKTSHLGTRFFAHARKDGSTCPRESESHLLAKSLIAKAVVETGWQADTEATLKPYGLIADVLATKGKQRIAFEVQLSRQKRDDTKSRHEAYRDAGVRALWLFKQADYPRNQDIPAFRICNDSQLSSFSVWVWPKGHEYEKASVPAQSINLDQFIVGALQGKLKWRPAADLTIPVIGHIAQVTCRKGHPTSILAFLEFDIDHILPGHSNPRISIGSFGEYPELLRTNSVDSLLGELGLSFHFGVRNWATNKWEENYQRYIYSCCSVCGELIDDRNHWDTATPSTPPFKLSIKLTETFINSIPELRDTLARWWFDCH